MKKLVLISCYIGSLPNYFQLFLDSCSWNDTIDWIIYGDDDISKFIFPSNVRFVNLTLNELRELIHNKIGSFAKLKSAYKICDYKPAYGLLFQKDITNYEYWGHCDLDIIWGDLKKFVLPLLEKNYDRLFKFGHLTIYKNNEETRNLFKRKYSGLNYKDVYKTSISCAFDESRGTWILGKENGINLYDGNIVFDIKRPGSSTKMECYGTNHENQAFLIKSGKIIRIFEDDNKIREEEKAYLHFQWRNLLMFPKRLSKIDCYQFLGNKIKEIEDPSNVEIVFNNNLDPVKITFKKRYKQINQILKFGLLKRKVKLYNKIFIDKH